MRDLWLLCSWIYWTSGLHIGHSARCFIRSAVATSNSTFASFASEPILFKNYFLSGCREIRNKNRNDRAVHRVPGSLFALPVIGILHFMHWIEKFPSSSMEC